LRLREPGSKVVSTDAVGAVAFLARRASEQLAAAKRFHQAAGAALDEAITAAPNDLPRLYIPRTKTEEHLVKAVRYGGRFLDCARDAIDALDQAHTEAELSSLCEMSLDREERRGER
jgi:hypothetical protein